MATKLCSSPSSIFSREFLRLEAEHQGEKIAEVGATRMSSRLDSVSEEAKTEADIIFLLQCCCGETGC